MINSFLTFPDTTSAPSHTIRSWWCRNRAPTKLHYLDFRAVNALALEFFLSAAQLRGKQPSLYLVLLLTSVGLSVFVRACRIERASLMSMSMGFATPCQTLGTLLVTEAKGMIERNCQSHGSFSETVPFNVASQPLSASANVWLFYLLWRWRCYICDKIIINCRSWPLAISEFTATAQFTPGKNFQSEVTYIVRRWQICS